MKTLMTMMLAMCMTLSLPACESAQVEDDPVVPESSQEEQEESNETETNEENDMITKMRMTVNGQTLTATLEDNVTARAIAQQLPMTLPMMDLYGREMCYRFTEALPTDSATTRGYEVGEIVYYPPMHSFVIMYAQNGEHFQMQSIGRVDSGVEIFNGIGDVDVTFEAIE